MWTRLLTGKPGNWFRLSIFKTPCKSPADGCRCGNLTNKPIYSMRFSAEMPGFGSRRCIFPLRKICRVFYTKTPFCENFPLRTRALQGVPDDFPVYSPIKKAAHLFCAAPYPFGVSHCFSEIFSSLNKPLPAICLPAEFTASLFQQPHCIFTVQNPYFPSMFYSENYH